MKYTVEHWKELKIKQYKCELTYIEKLMIKWYELNEMWIVAYEDDIRLQVFKDTLMLLIEKELEKAE